MLLKIQKVYFRKKIATKHSNSFPRSCVYKVKHHTIVLDRVLYNNQLSTNRPYILIKKKFNSYNICSKLQTNELKWLKVDFKLKFFYFLVDAAETRGIGK